MIALDASHIEHWQQLHEQEQSDPKWVDYNRDLDQKRIQAMEEMAEFLHAYLDGHISTEEFRATFQRKSIAAWNVFGIKGPSGAMLLNQFVKHVPDQDELAALLRHVLPVPTDESSARDQLNAIVLYMHELVAAHVVNPIQLQTVRISFFVSVWWHIQAPEQWPIFYPSARQSLQEDGLFTPTQDLVADYFAFRAVYNKLAAAMGISNWALEHLFAWYKEPKAALHSTSAQPEPTLDVEAALPMEEAAEVQTPATPQQVSAHTHVQLLLAKIGKHLGCNIWIAINDQGRQVDGGKLGDWSMKSLPTLGLDTNTQKVISRIDVLWIRGTHQVVAAFEVEHTTSIYSGLLRLSDLIAMSPNINFDMYIVSPNDRLGDVRRELSRPTFQALGLHERCGFFSEEDLHASADGIMAWASSPQAIKRRLAHYVGDVSSEETE